MATEHDAITPEQRALIENSKLFFIASADPSLGTRDNGCGPVNVSPKGGTPLRILDDNRVAYLDYTGSGNETARHADLDGPVTVMFCSFNDSDPSIVRLFGKARVMLLDDSPLRDAMMEFPFPEIGLPARQVIEIFVEKTQTSCGYGVPVMQYVGERPTESRGRAFKPDLAAPPVV
jgi:predicted pyridoxine 5'-phosphate oxidase superfamily flavin-nucleotide-binding protein